MIHAAKKSRVRFVHVFAFAATIVSLTFAGQSRADQQLGFGEVPTEVAEKQYAFFLTSTDACENLYPQRKAEYGKVRVSLRRFFESRRDGAAALRSPKLNETIAAVRAELEPTLRSDPNREVICNGLTQGKLWWFEIPIEP